MRFTVITVTTLAGTAPLATAQTFGNIDSNRNVIADARVFDLDDGDSDFSSDSTINPGVFAASVSASVNTRNQRTFGDSAAEQSSGVSASGISIFGRVEASAFGADESGGGNTSASTDLLATFSVTETTRISLSSFGLSDLNSNPNASATATISLTNRNGDTVYSFSITGDEGRSTFLGWVQPGDYIFSASAECGIEFSGAINEEDDRFVFFTEAEVDASITPFSGADFDANGEVNRADRDAFIAAWNARDLAADFDGNGRVNRADRRAFITVYRRDR